MNLSRRTICQSDTEPSQCDSSSSCEICTMVLAGTRLSCKYESPNRSSRHRSSRHRRRLHAISKTNPHESIKELVQGLHRFHGEIDRANRWKPMLRCLKGENKKQTVLGAGKVSSSAVALPTLSVQLYCRWENEWRRKLPLLRAQLGGREENRYFSLQCVPACGVLLETRFLFLVDPTQCVPLFL
jgi:hypothetical protein